MWDGYGYVERNDDPSEILKVGTWELGKIWPGDSSSFVMKYVTISCTDEML